VALLLVVVALALLGALALAAFGVASREQRGATDLMFATEAFEAAEGRLAAVEAGWDTTTAGLPVGVPHPGLGQRHDPGASVPQEHAEVTA